MTVRTLRLAEQPEAPLVGQRHAAEVAAVDVVDAVVPRQLLVEERVVGAQQLVNRPILADLALEEQLRLRRHRLAQRVVEVGEHRWSGVDAWMLRTWSHCPTKSFMNRVARRSASMRFTCCVEHRRILQLALRREVEQLVVGNAPPQEERQPRRQLEIAQPVDVAGLGAGRLALDAEQELRRRQQRFERALDAGVEVALAPAFAVDGQQRLDVGVGDRPAVGAPRQRGDDPARARLLVARCWPDGR